MFTPPSSVREESRYRGRERRQDEVEKSKWETEKKWRIRKTRTRIRREKEREGALFRQPDNIPSPEHIYGCPLTPSSSSL